jgi:hypothetical protein
MREPKVTVDKRNELLSVDELDAVIAAELVALVVVPVRIADRTAFLGIDHKRTVALGKLAVRHDVDTVVAHEPEAGLLAFAGPEAVIGITKPAIRGGVRLSARSITRMGT